MKRIYFVRHGESEGNAGAFRQGSDTVLSDKGREQARAVSERLTRLPIEVVISSTYSRAMETADIINETLGKPIERSDLLVERRRPSVISGKRNDDPGVIAIEKLIQNNFHEKDWRRSDEENFEDMKTRALDAIKYIESRKEGHILIVTHGIFLKMIAACIIMGEGLTSHEYHNLYFTLTTDNTGISVFEKLDSSKFDHPWIILTWNDRAHIEDLDHRSHFDRH
ncbi:MAG: histidine phosphatase family protein [Candidatus Paceibacterota bacterium]|jgi:broad specificity phosphatase PhoE